MAFLKFLKLKFEVRLSDQLQILLNVILFIVNSLLIEPLVIIEIVRLSVAIVVGHDWPPFRKHIIRGRNLGVQDSSYPRIAFFALAAMGSASLKALKEINRAYCLLPSESCPRWRENHTASWNLFDGDRRVKIWPFHSTAVAPSQSRLRTMAPIEAQSNVGYSLRDRW